MKMKAINQQMCNVLACYIPLLLLTDCYDFCPVIFDVTHSWYRNFVVELHVQADTEQDIKEEVGDRKPFRRFYYRGYEVQNLLDLSNQALMALLHSRARRKIIRGRLSTHLLKRLRKAKKDVSADGRPTVIKTHDRDMIILPEMVSSVVGVYNGKEFVQVEIKVSVLMSENW